MKAIKETDTRASQRAPVLQVPRDLWGLVPDEEPDLVLVALVTPTYPKLHNNQLSVKLIPQFTGSLRPTWGLILESDLEPGLWSLVTWTRGRVTIGLTLL